MKTLKIIFIVLFLVPFIVFVITMGIVHFLSSMADSYSSTTTMSSCSTFSNSDKTKESCSYKSFKGTKLLKTIRLKENQVFNAAYSVDLVSGDLKIQILNEDKTIEWARETNNKMDGNIEFKSQREGKYDIVLTSNASEGSYTMFWYK